MTGKGIRGRLTVRARRVRAFLARLLKWDRTPSDEVKELRAHLRATTADDAKLANQSRRKEKILRDNHLVSDVERALGLRS
jgi:hypothetical protein